MFIFCKLFWSKSLKSVPLNLKWNALWIQTWQGTGRSGSLREYGADFPVWLRTAEDRWLWAVLDPSLLELPAAGGEAGGFVPAAAALQCPKPPPLTGAAQSSPKQRGEGLQWGWAHPESSWCSFWGTGCCQSVLTQNPPGAQVRNCQWCQVPLPVARKNPQTNKQHSNPKWA